MAALTQYPDLPLWGDIMHASPDGAYFTACVFYAHFFNESPVGLDFFGEVDEASALLYQQLASRVTGLQLPEDIPSVGVLYNYPNPFNPRSTIFHNPL